MPMLNAGKYRHKITIKERPGDVTRDSFGGRRKNPAPIIVTVWAEKQDWSGAEVDEVGRETATVVTKWRIRYRTDVKPAMVVSFGDDVYEILSVLDFDGHRRELVIESRKVIE